MKNLSYLAIALIALTIGIEQTEAAAHSSKDPEAKPSLGLFDRLFSRHPKTAEEIAAADKKRHDKKHSDLMIDNPAYGKALWDYRGTADTMQFAELITKAMLEAHLKAIAQYEAAIKLLSPKEEEITHYQQRMVALDKAKTIARLLVIDATIATKRSTTIIRVKLISMSSNKCRN